MPQQQVRFTPEEIRALMASGELSMDLLRKMHPDDVKVANAIFNSGDYSQTDGHPASVPEQLGYAAGRVKDHPVAATGLGAALMVPAATTGALGAGLTGIAADLPMMAKMAGYTGLATLAVKLGVPASALEAAGFYAAMKGMGKGAAPAAAQEAETVEQALINKGINPANAGMAARGEKFPVPARRSPVPDVNFSSKAEADAATPFGPKGPLDVEKKIFGPQGSEAATFGVRPPAYSPNISTGATADDILEMLTGASHGQGSSNGTPVMYHGDSGPTMRSSVDKLKRATRRSPK